MKQIERAARYAILALVVIMPFHAFASVYLGHLVGHQSLIQGWKEVVIAVLVCLTAIYLWKRPGARKRLYSPLGVLLWAFIALALLITALNPIQPAATLLGIKTDIEFLVLFIIAMVFADRQTLERAVTWLIYASTAVAAIALVQPLFSESFLTSLGYNLGTIAPLQHVEGTHYLRVFSTLGGPNQLGAFLILPLCLLMQRLIKHFQWWQAAAFAVMLAALGLTYSRSAWLGAVAALAITLVLTLPRRRRFTGLIAAVAVVGLLGGIAVASVGHSTAFTSLVRHGATTATRTSDKDHASAIDTAIADTEQNPFGTGLGTAGPASFKSDHPIITENYYLQLAIETGLLGLTVFVVFLLVVGYRLVRTNIPTAVPLLGALVGISIVNLFLHGWADSTLAICYWSLAGLTVGLTKDYETKALDL
jgi:putative inorganic carbon (hco3(-)) transporter